MDPSQGHIFAVADVTPGTSYFGWVIERMDTQTPVYGEVDIIAFNNARGRTWLDFFPRAFVKQQMVPHVPYRVILLSDRPQTIFFDVLTSVPRSFVTSQPVSVDVVNHQTSVGAITDVRAPVSGSGGAFALDAFNEHFLAGATSQPHVCIVPTGGTCPYPPFAFTGPFLPNDEFTWWTIVPGAYLPSGPREIVGGDDGAGVAGDRTVFALVVH